MTIVHTIENVQTQIIKTYQIKKSVWFVAVIKNNGEQIYAASWCYLS